VRRAALVAVVIALAVGCSSKESKRANAPAARDITVALADGRPALPPFAGYTETDVKVGNASLRVVVADDPLTRSAGLRGNEDPAPYAGMLFADETDSTNDFTNAGVDAALSIAWFDADGRRVGEAEMLPCAGTQRECPTYSADRPYRYAVETPAGQLPGGHLHG
jgi:uncharacterized membrane protein (UPF0127 family)